MANWSTLKAAIAQIIKTNNNQEITGANMQSVLNNIIDNVGENATYAGIATPSTNPGAPDGPIFYFANSAGVYSNFNNIEVYFSEIGILYWNTSSWEKHSISLSKLIEEVNISNIYPTDGKDGSNKYTLETAIAKVGEELRHAGLKVTFINGEGTTETWEYQGGTFTAVASWRKSDAVEVVQDLGDDENAVVSQKTVTDELKKINANTGIDEYPAFSDQTAYKAGCVVNYQGKLYQFTTDHAAGAWTGTDVKVCSLKKDIDDNIDRIDTDIDIYSDILQDTTNIFAIKKRYVSLNGEEKGTSLNLNCTDYLPISAFKDVLVYAYNYSSSDARFATFFDDNRVFLGASSNGNNTYKEFSIEELAEGFEGAEYVRLSVRFDYDYGIYTTWKKQINTDIEGINTDIDNFRKENAVLLGRKLTSTNLIAEQNPRFIQDKYYSPSAGWTDRVGYACHVWIEVKPNTQYYCMGQAFEFDEEKNYLNIYHAQSGPAMASLTSFTTSANCKYLVLSYPNTPQYIQPGTEYTNGYWLSEVNGTQKNTITDEYLDIEEKVEKIISSQQEDLIFSGCKMVQSHGAVIDFSSAEVVSNALIKNANIRMFSDNAKMCCGIKADTDSYIRVTTDISSWNSLTFVMFCPYDTNILTTGKHSGYIRMYLNNQGNSQYGTWFNGRCHAGWNFITITKEDITQIVDIISDIYIKFEARDTVITNTQFANLILDSIILDLKVKPTILINFDQLWHESQENGGYQKLFDSNIPATFFSKNYADMDEKDILYIKELSNIYGWELGSYSNVGASNGVIERATSYTTAKESCNDTVADFVNTFLTNTVSFAATQAQCNEIGREAILKSGYIGIRYMGGLPMTYFNKEVGGWIQHHDVASLSLQNMKDELDKCITYGLVWAWFTHGICADGEQYMLTNDTQERGTSSGVQKSIFNDFIDYLKTKTDAGEIQAITFKEFYRQCGIKVR